MCEKKLNIYEFKELLEKEYVQYALCSLIFEGEYSEKYKRKLFNHKMKIEGICEKICEDNIFTSEERLNDIIKDLLPKMGKPNFVFRSDNGYESMRVVTNSHLYKTVKTIVKINTDEVYGVLRNIPTREVLVLKKEDGSTIEANYDELQSPIEREDLKNYIFNEFSQDFHYSVK